MGKHRHLDTNPTEKVQSAPQFGIWPVYIDAMSNNSLPKLILLGILSTTAGHRKKRSMQADANARACTKRFLCSEQTQSVHMHEEVQKIVE